MRSRRSRMSIWTSRWLFCGDDLAGLRRDLQPEHARAGLRRGESDAHRDRIAVGGQPHRLRSDDPSVVLDVERDGLAGVAGLRQHGVHQQRRALERGPRRRDAAHLDVVRQRLLPDADREHRQRFRLRREQRVGNGRVGRVGAVGDQHQPRDRQAGEFLSRALDRVRQPRLRAAERQVRRRARPRDVDEENRNVRTRNRSDSAFIIGLSGLPNVCRTRSARGAVPVFVSAAACCASRRCRMPIDVLLRDRRLDHQHRPEDAEEDDARAPPRAARRAPRARATARASGPGGS